MMKVAQNAASRILPVENVAIFLGASTWRGREVQLLGGLVCLSLACCLVRFVAQRRLEASHRLPAEAPLQAPVSPQAPVNVQPSKAETPPGGGQCFLSSTSTDIMLEVYSLLDIDSCHCFSVAGRSVSLSQYGVLQQRCIALWIERSAKAGWRSSSQKHQVHILFKILFSSPQDTIFPAPEAATIPRMRAIFQSFENSLRQERFSDPSTDRLHQVYDRLADPLEISPKLQSFLRNIPTVWQIGFVHVTGIQEISHRYEAGPLTEQDGTDLRDFYQSGVGNFGDCFVQGASVGFLEAVLKTFSIRKIDQTNCFFVDYNIESALKTLAKKDLEQFRQKFSVFLHFYDHQMVRGTSNQFEVGKAATLKHLVSVLRYVLKEQRLSLQGLLPSFPSDIVAVWSRRL